MGVSENIEATGALTNINEIITSQILVTFVVRGIERTTTLLLLAWLYCIQASFLSLSISRGIEQLPAWLA
jgi:hypothetical protein